jgi:hypothetical protein
MWMRSAMMSRSSGYALRRRLKDGGRLRECLQTLGRLTCQRDRGSNIAEHGDRDEGEKGSHATSRARGWLPPTSQTMPLLAIGGSTDLRSALPRQSPDAPGITVPPTKAFRASDAKKAKPALA